MYLTDYLEEYFKIKKYKWFYKWNRKIRYGKIYYEEKIKNSMGKQLTILTISLFSNYF